MIRLLTILLFATSVAHGQFKTAVFNIDGSSIKVGAIYHIPPPGPGKAGTIQPSGNKPSMCLWLDGIDKYYLGSANSGQYDTSGTAWGNAAAPPSHGGSGNGGVKWLTSRAIPKLAEFSPMPYFQLPGTVGSTGLERAAIFAPQCDAQTPEWPQNLLIGAIKYIINTYGTQIDTNRIWVFGYSLGGIGAKHFAANAYLRSKVSYVFILSPGPDRAADFAGAAASGLPIDMMWNILDGTALASYGWASPFIQNMNANSPMSPTQYYELAQANTTWYGPKYHDTHKLLLDSTDTFHPLLTNGDTWIRGKMFPFPRAASFTKNRLHR